MKHKQKNSTIKFILLISAPFLLFMLLITALTSHIFYSGFCNEMRYGLKNLALLTYDSIAKTYPGDYSAAGGQLFKGGVSLSDALASSSHFQIFSETDIRLFCGDTCCASSLHTAGLAVSGIQADPQTAAYVLKNGTDYFSDRTKINGVAYFGYYFPIQDKDGATIGMLFTGKPRSIFFKNINWNLLTVGLLALTALSIGIFLTIWYGKRTATTLLKIKSFLAKISGGDLTASLDPRILHRQDEIGDLGRYAVKLQNSISSLVGKDPLTGLYNRRSCDAILRNMDQKSHKTGNVFTLVIGDVDHFKWVNDTYGHQAGDAVLKRIAQVILHHIEHLGFAFRWGGEEFLLIYEDTCKAQAIKNIQRLQEEINKLQFFWNGAYIQRTMTFGVADSTQASDTKTLLRLADESLYQGKEQGRNRIISAPSKPGVK